MATRLAQYGYLTLEYNAKVDLNEFAEKFDNEMHGRLEHTPQGIEGDAKEQRAMRQEEEDARAELEEADKEATPDVVVDMVLLGRAIDIDPDAVEDITVAHNGDDAAFMRALQEFVDARLAENAGDDQDDEVDGGEAAGGRRRRRRRRVPTHRRNRSRIVAREKAETEAAAARAKSAAEDEVASFGLTGSGRPADAQGQGDLATPPATPQELFVVGPDGTRYPVESIQDAGRNWRAVRSAATDTGEGGVSQTGNGLRVVDQDGKEVARISYNGRVWPPGELKAARCRCSRPTAPPAGIKKCFFFTKGGEIVGHTGWTSRLLVVVTWATAGPGREYTAASHA